MHAISVLLILISFTSNIPIHTKAYIKVPKLTVIFNLFIYYERVEFYTLYAFKEEPGYRSRYTDWIRAGLHRGRSSSPGRVKNFLLSTLSRPTLGSTQPPIQWVQWAISLGVKRPGREAEHSPPTSAEVKKNVGLYIHTPYAFMAQFLIS
jgi:hypothetical protein